MSRQLLRQQIRQYRQQLSAQQQTQASQLLLTRLTNHAKIMSAKSVAIYLANDGELATMPFIEWCWQQNKQVYLPVIDSTREGHLLFVRYTKDSVMIKNQYGISEPELTSDQCRASNNIDIIFTPLVAFDDSGARLGMGGGFYDRTLAQWYNHYKTDKLTRPYPIGLSHDCQKVDKIPCEHWDIPIPEIITPEKQYLFELT